MSADRQASLEKWIRECEAGKITVTSMMRSAYRDGFDDARAASPQAPTVDGAEATTVYDPAYVREKFADYQRQIDGLKEELAHITREAATVPLTDEQRNAIGWAATEAEFQIVSDYAATLRELFRTTATPAAESKTLPRESEAVTVGDITGLFDDAHLMEKAEWVKQAENVMNAALDQAQAMTDAQLLAHFDIPGLNLEATLDRHDLGLLLQGIRDLLAAQPSQAQAAEAVACIHNWKIAESHSDGNSPWRCAKCGIAESATPPASPVASEREGLTYPAEFTDDLQWILGLMCFQCIQYAQALRKGGREIPSKAEAEQAATLDFLLRRYMRDPDNWRKTAADELREMAATRTGSDK